ncbi:MAG: ornithine carbamoyltransferase [Elusimicrobiota bacterium]|jgi:ornithine carbamoyltransferase|nr:ornithine carbamoyltransferase [Elusimicrobiota bacterium]
MKGKDLLTIEQLSVQEVSLILETASKLKQLQKNNQPHKFMDGKNLAMIFHKASTRTRVSFEAGFAQMGGHALYLDNSSTQMGRGEPIKDTARVLSRYVDIIMIRTFAQKMVEELAFYASVPVINGLTDLSHPCQALADIMTVCENFQTVKHKKFVFIGDGNNVANSLMFACAKIGMDIVVCSPKGYQPSDQIVSSAKKAAAETGSKISIETDPLNAAKGADVLYTDVWASMGQESERQERIQFLHNYKIDDDLLKISNKDCIVMHCLPAHRGEEITDEVMEGAHCKVFDEAENRLHVQKAIMFLLTTDKKI